MLGGLYLALQIGGICGAFHALMTVRTSQGTVAWVIALVAFPGVALPLYLVFGRNQFQGYVEAIQNALEEKEALVPEARKAMEPQHGIFNQKNAPAEYALDQLTARHFTRGNGIELLIDGKETFPAIFSAIEQARDYVLAQFFIVKEDEIGFEFKRLLVEKARQGVRVCFLYDQVGSHKLSRSYKKDLRAAGCEVHAFGTRGGLPGRLQINFRNHRKIVVTDGRRAFVGGLNIGDEYDSKDPRFGHWRDTHVALEGPVVQGVQAVFLEDWFWAARNVPQLEWSSQRCENADERVLPLSSGPVHSLETCSLFFHQLIAAAQERLWVASPYFVPDEGTVHALQLAAKRGVDVRIMLPSNPDHLLVWLASFSYLPQMDAAGVKMFQYQKGFLHQKAALVDDRLAFVGTANLDNRSFRLNFELNMVASGGEFPWKVEKMLEEDFSHCRRIESGEFLERSLFFRAASRSARLLAPVL